MLPAGKLRCRVTLQKPTRTQNTHGESVETWVNKADRWAAIEAVGGSEQVIADQVHPRLTHQVRIRYLEGLTSDWRVKYGTRVLNIARVVDVDERHVEHLLLCEEAV